MHANRWLTVLLLLTLSACGTTYQSQSWTGGFSEVQLDENIFEITFKGNAFVDASTVRDYAMLRAAEVTLDHGFEYFVVADEDNWTKIQTVTTGGNSSTTTYSGTVSGNMVSGTANTAYNPPQTTTYNKPRSLKTIVTFHEKPEGLTSYSARFVRDSIRKSHKLDE